MLRKGSPSSSSATIPARGARRFRSTSYTSAFRGDTYRIRTPGLASGSRRLTRSIAQRKAAKVFPLPVGAMRRAFRPEARTGHPSRWIRVGARCVLSNHERTAGRKVSIEAQTTANRGAVASAVPTCSAEMTGRVGPHGLVHTQGFYRQERVGTALVAPAVLMYNTPMRPLLFALAGVLSAGRIEARQAGEADVIVVGAGIAGLSSALEAARGGATVLVVDMWSIFGGHAVLSHGGLCHRRDSDAGSTGSGRHSRARGARFSRVGRRCERALGPLLRGELARADL